MDEQGDPYYSFSGDDLYFNPPNGTRFNPVVIPADSHPQPPSWNSDWNGLPDYTQSQFTNFGYVDNRFSNPPHVSGPPFVPPHLRVRPKKKKNPQKPLHSQNIPCLLSIKFNKEDFSPSASKKNNAEAVLPKPVTETITESNSVSLGDSGSLTTSLNGNGAATKETTSGLSLNTGTVEGDYHHTIEDKNNYAVSSDAAEDKDENDHLTRSLCVGFVTETNETDSNMDSSNNGSKKAELSNLPTSSTFRQRSNSDSSDRTVVIPREKNSAFPKRTAPSNGPAAAGDVLRVTPLGSFNTKLAREIKREIGESSDMEGNQSIRGSRGVEGLPALDGLNAQSSNPVQEKREKLTSGLSSILAKRHQRPNLGGQGKDAVEPTPVSQGPNTSGALSKKLSIDEYRNRQRKTAVPQSQSSPSAASDVSSLASDDSTNKQQPPAQGSSVLFTRRRSVEQPVPVLPSPTVPLSSGSRNKSTLYDGPYSSSSADVAYDRRPRGAVQAVDLTPATGQLWASNNAALGAPSTSTSPSLNRSVFLEAAAAPTASSISPSVEINVGSCSEPEGQTVIVQKPRDFVAATNIVAPESLTAAIEPPTLHVSKNSTFRSSKKQTSENEIMTSPNGDLRVNSSGKTVQQSPITPSFSETRITEYNQVQWKTLESNKENLDRTELCGLDFWNKIVAEDHFTLSIPKMLISDDEIRRDFESMDFGENFFSEKEVKSAGAQTAGSVSEVLAFEVNADATTPSEDEKSEESKQTENELQSKSLNEEFNRQDNEFPSSQPHETEKQGSNIGLEVAEKLLSSTEGSNEQINTELLTINQPDTNATNNVDNVASHQDMEIDEVFEVVADPSKVVEESNDSEGETDKTLSATDHTSKNEEIRGILSEETNETVTETSHQNKEVKNIHADDHALEAENTTQEQTPATTADTLSSTESGNETMAAPTTNISPFLNESSLLSSSPESENTTAVPDPGIDNANTATQISGDGPLRAAAKLKSLMKARPDLYSKSSRSSKRTVPEESPNQAVSKRKRGSSEESAEPSANTGVDSGPSSETPANDSQHLGVTEVHSSSSVTAISNSDTTAPSELQSEANGEAEQISNLQNDYSELTISELLKDSKKVPVPKPKSSEEQPKVLASKLGVVANRSFAVQVPETQGAMNVCKEVQCEIWKKADICSSCNLSCKKCSPVNSSRPSCYLPQECFPPNNEEGYRFKKNKLISSLKNQLKLLNSKLEKFQNETTEADPEGLLNGMTDLRRDVVTCANLIDVNVIQFEQMRSKTPAEIAIVSTVNCEKISRIEKMPGYLEILFLYDTYSRQEEFKNHALFRHFELFRYRALRTLKWKCRDKDTEEGSLLSIYNLLAKTNQGWSIEQLARCWDSVKQFRGELDTGAIEAEFNSTGDKAMLSTIAKIVKIMDADIKKKKQKQSVTGFPIAGGNASAGTVKVMPSTSGPSPQITSTASAHIGAPTYIVHHTAPGLQTPHPGNEQLPFDAIRQSGIPSQSIHGTGPQAQAPNLITRPNRARSRAQQMSTISIVRPTNFPTSGGMAQIHPVQQPGLINRGQYRAVLQQFVSSRSQSPAIGQQQQINLPPDVTVIPVRPHNPSATHSTSQNTVYHQQQPMQRNSTFIHQVDAQNHQYQGNVVRGPNLPSQHVSVIAGNAASQVNRRSSGIHAQNSQNVSAHVPPTNQASSMVNAQVFIDSLIESYFQDSNENH